MEGSSCTWEYIMYRKSFKIFLKSDLSCVETSSYNVDADFSKSTYSISRSLTLILFRKFRRDLNFVKAIPSLAIQYIAFNAIVTALSFTNCCLSCDFSKYFLKWSNDMMWSFMELVLKFLLPMVWNSIALVRPQASITCHRIGVPVIA